MLYVPRYPCRLIAHQYEVEIWIYYIDRLGKFDYGPAHTSQGQIEKGAEVPSSRLVNILLQILLARRGTGKFLQCQILANLRPAVRVQRGLSSCKMARCRVIMWVAVSWPFLGSLLGKIGGVKKNLYSRVEPYMHHWKSPWRKDVSSATV